MAKLHVQIILLFWKNLSIRFSHRCVTFCELILPFLLTALIGLTISYSTLGTHTRSYSRDVTSKSRDSDNITDIIDSKFTCDLDWHSDTQYNCETPYYSINSLANMEKVKTSNIIYLFDTTVKNKELAEAVMTSVLGSTTSWTKSTKSENELEICIVQDLEECKETHASVIITDIQDAITDTNKFSVNYKIRMNKNRAHHHFLTNTLFFDNSGPNLIFVAIEQAYMGTMESQWMPYIDKVVGFIHIQALMDKGITKYVSSKNGTIESKVDLSLVRMPFQYANNGHGVSSEVSKAFSLMYSLMFSLTIFSLMRINSEKCSGFKELLRMHGVSAWTQWMGWLFTSFVVYGTWTALLTLVLWLPLLGGQNFISLVGINCFIYWLLLILYVMSITTFSYLISVFFEKVWTAVSIGLVCWILLIVFMIVTSTMFYSLTKGTAMGLMLVPTVAFDFAFRLALNDGGTFSTVASQVFENVPLTMVHCLFMLLLDSCIYMTLAIYLDNVLPSKYGIRKSPLYFLRDLWKLIFKFKRGDAKYHTENDGDELTHASVEMTSIISGGTDQPFQPDPEHVEAAIVIQNLRKEFRRNKKRAVDGLTTKMFTGEIYTLLGFNGAGKTTTIGILTGLTSPTNGYARIFDLDIRKDMEEIRKYIGLCPQHNLLFDEMSVWDQVAFFGKLKGLKDSKAKAKEILTLMGMVDKLANKPEQLSGGQKRRVHLAIALIGDTKLAFLDEPTSGLDPETRRGVWDILVKLRGKLTIILTTHDMEEADLLGDRIGIMSEGKMICSGTGSFLKNYYGVGYNLKMSVADSQCDPEKVYSFVCKYVPTAKMDLQGAHPSSLPTTSSLASVSISLPTADLDLGKVADLMDALREQQQQLGVDNLGLSLSTMDEVFLKVGEVVHAISTKVPICDPSNNDVSSSRYVGSRLMWYRYATLVYKRMMYFLSASFTLLFLIIFFSVILLLALVTLSYAINTSDLPDPPRVVSSSALSSYNSPIVFIHEQSNNTNESNLDYTLAYLTQLHKHSKHIQVQEYPKTKSLEQIIRSLKKASIDDIHHYRQHYIVGASFDRKQEPVELSGYFSAYAVHSAPLSLNLLSQTVIKKVSGVDAKIGVTNHPFQWMEPHFQYITAESAFYRNRDDALFYAIKSGGVIILVVIVSLLTGTSALLPAEERLNKGKHLQIMTGTTPFIYWSAMFTWDFLFFTLVNIIITLIYILADYWSGNWLFTNNGAGWIIFLILECHSFAALWFCYLVSWAPCIKTGADAFLIVNKFAIVVGVLWNIMRHLLIVMTVNNVLDENHEGNSYLAKSIYYISHMSGYVLWVVPMHSLYLSMLKIASMSLPNSVCHWFPQDVLDLACHDQGIQERKELFIHSCCANCRENCFQPEPSYFNTSSTYFFDNDYETHSFVFDILGMVLSGIIFAGILFSLEYLLPFMRAKSYMERMAKECATAPEAEDTNVLSSSHDTQLEEDVPSEAARVADIVKDDALETANHALIAHNLQLEFGKLKAVKGLSFGVHRGECFGLLGVNGAGKTSTFRILTGDIFPTSGDVYAGGLNYYKHRTSYLSSIGYCPQFDGIIGSLTGLQMLKLYGALRGIPPERLKEDATIWLDKFGLLGYANKKCGNYSGGMKRRLSAAIALIGNPKLLLLDEPTTGVDPAFRRQFWDVIKEIRERGQSVVLTSHTMDECEALCTRLGIMIDGQFKCLGNIQHLKCKFGKGYILSLKFKRVAEEYEQENEVKLNLLLEEIVEKFSPCRLQAKQTTLVQYQILNKSLWYSDLFRTMEEIRKSDPNTDIIEEYSVTETSLEDVFISFAEKPK